MKISDQMLAGIAFGYTEDKSRKSRASNY